jgi:hypothetical protein
VLEEVAGERRCNALTRSGTQCRVRALPNRAYCALHSPEAVQGRRVGGVARSNVARGLKRLPPSLRDVMDMIAEGIRECHEGTLKPAQLQAMAAGGRTLIELVEAAVLAPELEALRLQVAELLALSRREEGGGYVES